jgi:hypothetical protein
LQRGYPLSIGGNSNLGNSGLPNIGNPRASVVGPRKMNDSGSLNARLNEWFDTSAFAVTQGFGYGTDSRTEPNLRSDGIKNIDFAAFKDTRFGPDDRLGLEFRAEFFNFFNHPQFAPPNTSCCTSVANGGTFGQITSQYNLPRVVQFGLRLSF